MVKLVELGYRIWDSGWIKDAREFEGSVAAEFGKLLEEAQFLDGAPFSSIRFFLQLDDKETGGPKINFIHRAKSQLNVEAKINWTDDRKGSRDQIKMFFMRQMARCALYVAQEYNLPQESLIQKLSQCGVELDPADISRVHPALLKNSQQIPITTLEIAIKMSDDGFGTERERELAQKLGKDLERRGKEFAADFDGTLAGEGFYYVQVSCEEPRAFFGSVEKFLKSKRLPKGSYVSARYFSGLYFENDRFELI